MRTFVVRVFNEKYAVAARGFNEAPWRDAVHVVPLLKGFRRALDLRLRPRCERGGQHPHQDDERQRKLQHGSDPRQKAASPRTEPDDHFTVLPASHHHHQNGDENRNRQKRRHIDET